LDGHHHPPPKTRGKSLNIAPNSLIRRGEKKSLQDFFEENMVKKVYQTFEQEKESEGNPEGRYGWRQEIGRDPGIALFLRDFNRLPFAYSTDWSCSGLFRDHQKQHSCDSQMPKGFTLDSLPLTQYGDFYFSFVLSLKDGRAKELLERMRLTNQNEYSKLRLGWHTASKSTSDFNECAVRGYREVAGGHYRVEVIHEWQKFLGIINVRSKISAREIDRLRDLQIQNLHQVILEYL
jgi:hypothetical protein